MNFKELKDAHDKYIFAIFNDNPLYLLLNQFMRTGNKDLQHAFLEFIDFQLNTKNLAKQFEEVYNFCNNNNLFDKIIQFINDNRQLSFWYTDSETEKQLHELSTISLVQDEFSPNSSIDKQIFSKVKKSTNIEDINNIVSDMNRLMKIKIYWTYYNTQTTRIIEDIFSRHKKVLPTLVDIKGVDFFIDMIPLDLKITHIPKGFNENFNKQELIKWLYENQSEQRFAAENRLFLILNDKNNPTNTDKLKITHYHTIKDTINNYLNNFDKSNLQNITFSFKNNVYYIKSDIIFINII